MNYQPNCNNPDVTTLYVTEAPIAGFAQKINFAQKILILHKNSKITEEEMV